MEIKRVICKACGVKLEIKNPSGEAVKIIRCPRCKSTLQVVFHQPTVSASPDETVLPQQKKTVPHAPDAEETSLPIQQAETDPLPSLVCNDQEYPLKAGQNIVGRRSESSAATIQITTGDRTMSRAHAIINVVRLANGSYKTIISNYQNKNSISVNGVVLQRDEQVVLTNGSVMELGLTSITFVQKNKYHENKPS